MEKPIKCYFDIALRNIVITNKKLGNRYRYLSSYTSVANAESAAERMTEEDGEIFRPQLDKELANESLYTLSGADKSVYCVEF